MVSDTYTSIVLVCTKKESTDRPSLSRRRGTAAAGEVKIATDREQRENTGIPHRILTALQLRPFVDPLFVY